MTAKLQQRRRERPTRVERGIHAASTSRTHQRPNRQARSTIAQRLGLRWQSGSGDTAFARTSSLNVSQTITRTIRLYHASHIL